MPITQKKFAPKEQIYSACSNALSEIDKFLTFDDFHPMCRRIHRTRLRDRWEHICRAVLLPRFAGAATRHTETHAFALSIAAFSDHK